jgi:hypothetical protein
MSALGLLRLNEAITSRGAAAEATTKFRNTPLTHSVAKLRNPASARHDNAAVAVVADPSHQNPF